MASNKVKVPLLIFILGMPVLIYLFLQGFGENKYEIPIVYPDGIPELDPNCPGASVPHKIDRVINQEPCSTWNCSSIGQKLVLFSFAGSDCQDNLAEIARVCNLFKDESRFSTITLALDSAKSQRVLNRYFEQYPIAQDAWIWWSFHQFTTPVLNCGLNLKQDCSIAKQVVLVDSDYQIRGYYQIEDAEEFDRMVTEINILLKENS